MAVLALLSVNAWLRSRNPFARPPESIDDALSRVGRDTGVYEETPHGAKVSPSCAFLMDCGPPAIPKIIEAHRAATDDLRRALLVGCMAHIGGPDVDTYLLSLLQTPSRKEDILHVACHAHCIQDPRVFPLIIEHLDDPDLVVRMQLEETLCRLTGEEANESRSRYRKEDSKKWWKEWWNRNSNHLNWDARAHRWSIGGAGH